MTPETIKALQRRINKHAAKFHIPLLEVDGEYGPRTRVTGRRVAFLMGVKLGPGHSLTQRAKEVINGAKRNPWEVARAKHRKHLRPLRLRAWDQMEHLIELGVVEQGSNNHGVWVEKIIRANGGVPGEAWCGDTVAACYLWAGSKTVLRSWASVSWLTANLQKVRRPKKGHIVTYVFSHTGLFDKWVSSTAFLAGEGNTGDIGAVSDSTSGHDGVKLKERSTSLVAGWRRVIR